MNLIGFIKKIYPKESFENFEKQQVVVNTEEEYSQPILIEFHNANTYYLDKFTEGQKVEINFNIRGREWTNNEGKIMYFNSVIGWKIKAI